MKDNWFISSDGEYVLNLDDLSCAFMNSGGSMTVYLRSHKDYHSVNKTIGSELLNEIARRRMEPPLR